MKCKKCGGSEDMFIISKGDGAMAKVTVVAFREIEEYCKFTKIKGNHKRILKICKENYHECVKLYPCVFL